MVLHTLSPQGRTTNLARVVTQRLINELEAARNLVPHHAFSEVLNQRRFRDAAIWCIDDGVHGIAEIFVR